MIYELYIVDHSVLTKAKFAIKIIANTSNYRTIHPATQIHSFVMKYA